MSIRVAFSMEGNMGSILLRTNFVKKFVSLLPRKQVDVTIFGHPNMEITNSIFSGLDFVDHIDNRKNLRRRKYRKYDLILKLDTFPIVLHKSMLLGVKSRTCFKVAKHIEEFAKNNSKWIKHTPVFRPNIYQLAKMYNKNCVNCIDFDNFVGLPKDFIYTITPPTNMTDILSKWGLKAGQYITLNRGSYTIPGQGEGTRVWPLAYYDKLVALLKKEYPALKIVQLGQTDDCPKVTGCDLCLCGKTDLDELKALLYSAVLHIDGEGGMPHLRKAMNAGPSVVLFGSTDPAYFGHITNINLVSNACPCKCCEMHDLWISKCLVTDDGAPLCLLKLTPDVVFKRIQDYMKDKTITQNDWISNVWPGTQDLIKDNRFVLDKDWVLNWLRYVRVNGYELVQLPLSDIRYWRQTDELGNGVFVPLVEEDNPAIAFNKNNIETYNAYNKMKQEFHSDTLHSQEKYQNLISQMTECPYDIKTGIIVIDKDNIIMDGWHRASYLASCYGKDYKICVLKLNFSAYSRFKIKEEDTKWL